MNHLNLHTNVFYKSTAIPDVFFDTYMLRANGEFLKVYLFLCRWCKEADADLSVTGIADSLSLTESDVIRALRYWQKEGLVSLSTDPENQLWDLTLLPIVDSGNPHSGTASPWQQNPTFSSPKQPAAVQQQHSVTAPAAQQNPAMAPSASPTDYVKPSYTMAQIQAFTEETKDDQLFLVIEQYIGKPLSQNDMNTIVFFYEKLGFSPSLIEYLVEYCIGNEHYSLRYMEKVAISWAQAGVDSVTKAKQYTGGYGKIYYEVLRAFGIHNRGPAASESEFISKWINQYSFSSGIILEACNRTIAKIHQPSFNYADKILREWHDKKVVHLEDIQAIDAEFDKQRKAAAIAKASNAGSASKPQQNNTAGANHSFSKVPVKKGDSKNRFHNFNQRTYNYSDLEQRLARKRQETSGSDQ